MTASSRFTIRVPRSLRRQLLAEAERRGSASTPWLRRCCSRRPSFRHPEILSCPFQPEDHFLIQRATIAAGRLLDLLSQRHRDPNAEGAEFLFIR